MKNITEYLVNESRTADLFSTVADCISNKDNVTDNDVKNIIKGVNDVFHFTLTDEEAKTLAQDIIDNFPEMIQK